jgi:hypothetical protein
MFVGVIEELRAMTARIDTMSCELREVGLEFEADSLEDLVSGLDQSITELVDANMALRAIVPNDAAHEVHAVFVRHGFKIGEE